VRECGFHQSHPRRARSSRLATASSAGVCQKLWYEAKQRERGQLSPNLLETANPAFEFLGELNTLKCAGNAEAFHYWLLVEKAGTQTVH
jgi:hypothetical protein